MSGMHVKNNIRVVYIYFLGFYVVNFLEIVAEEWEAPLTLGGGGTVYFATT